MDATAWRQWTKFCEWLGIPTDLAHIRDPVPILQLFAHQIRSGVLAASRNKVRKCQVEQYLRSVAQIFASVGACNPRMDAMGAIDFRLQRQLRFYSKGDPPPARVKPVPLSLLLYLWKSLPCSDARNEAFLDMLFVAFFFLLRPGEYCAGTSDGYNAPFCLGDAFFHINNRKYTTFQLSPSLVNSLTHCHLVFDNQKNGVRGEAIGHGPSNDPTACPVCRLASRALALRSQGGTRRTPLCAYYYNNRWHSVCASDITALLRRGVTAIGKDIGLRAQEISARSMRAGGAMALLLGCVDSDTI
eukprot:6725067-Ditylum_brightwellii.AAC.2